MFILFLLYLILSVQEGLFIHVHSHAPLVPKRVSSSSSEEMLLELLPFPLAFALSVLSL